MSGLKFFEANCCVVGCSSSPHTGQTFHLFPPYLEKITVPFKDESGCITFVSRREAWMMLLNLNNISIRTRVCSKHFEDSEFQKTRRPSSCHKIINKNMLRTSALPTLNLPKPIVSGEQFYIVKHLEKPKVPSTNKSRKLIIGVTAYVCCVPDCLHNSVVDKCKLFVIPNNPTTAKSAWNEFNCKMKQNLNKDSRVCSCHFFNDNLEQGPVFYPSDLLDALCLSLDQKKQYIYKIIPSSYGSWDLVSELHYKNSQNSGEYSFECDESVESSKFSTRSSDVSVEDLLPRRNTSAPDRLVLANKNPESFNRYTGFKSYGHFKTFLSVFDKDYIDVLTERTKLLSFEDQILLTLIKLRHDVKFSYLGREFKISSGQAQGIYERCLAVMENALCDGILDAGRWECGKTLWKEIPECDLVFYPIQVTLEGENSSRALKHKDRTFKSLVSVTPGGLMTYAGPFFPAVSPIEEMVSKSKLHSIAQPGDIIFISSANALQVKEVKNSQIRLTPNSFFSDSLIQHYLIEHIEKVTQDILNYTIVKSVSAEGNHVSLRIWRIVCALNNFNCFDPKELCTYYLNSQKIYDGEDSDEDTPNQFVNLLPNPR